MVLFSFVGPVDSEPPRTRHDGRGVLSPKGNGQHGNCNLQDEYHSCAELPGIRAEIGKMLRDISGLEFLELPVRELPVNAYCLNLIRNWSEVEVPS